MDSKMDTQIDRTIYLAPILEPQEIEAIKQYLCYFGPVESIDVEKDGTFQYALARFKSVEGAQNALERLNPLILNSSYSITTVLSCLSFFSIETIDSKLERTVYVAPIELQIVTKIEDYSLKIYFESFGPVELFCVKTEGDSQYALVQFKRVEDAKKVLKKSHCVEKCSFTTVVARSHFPDNPWAPDFESESNILNALNDDCLQTIFKHLSIFDLANAADVCFRFNQHAKRAFVAQHRDKSVEISNVFKYKESTILKTEYDVSPIFRHFGSLIEKLVIRNCIFSKTSDAKAFPLLCNLKVLHIVGSEWESPLLMSQRFAKLEEFRFECNSIITHQQRKTAVQMDLYDFLTTNQTLKKLEIIERDRKMAFLYLDNVIRLIGQYHNNLVGLEIELFSYDISSISVQSLSNLKSLKSLTLNFFEFGTDEVFYQLAVGNASIEVLTLKYDRRIKDRLIETICQMKQIKVLNLQYMSGLSLGRPLLQEGLNVNNLKEIVTHATKLSKLNFYPDRNLVIGVEDYESMLQSVRSRPEKVPLRIDVHVGNRYSHYYARPVVNVEQEVRQMNPNHVVPHRILNVPQVTLQRNRDYIDIQIHNAEN